MYTSTFSSNESCAKFITTAAKNDETSLPELIMPINRFRPSNFSRAFVERKALSSSRRSSSIWGGGGGGGGGGLWEWVEGRWGMN